MADGDQQYLYTMLAFFSAKGQDEFARVANRYGRTLYIGRSNDSLRRLGEHTESGSKAFLSRIPVVVLSEPTGIYDETEMEEHVEAPAIQAANPPFNQKHNNEYQAQAEYRKQILRSTPAPGPARRLLINMAIVRSAPILRVIYGFGGGALATYTTSKYGLGVKGFGAGFGLVLLGFLWAEVRLRFRR